MVWYANDMACQFDAALFPLENILYILFSDTLTHSAPNILENQDCSRNTVNNFNIKNKPSKFEHLLRKSTDYMQKDI